MERPETVRAGAGDGSKLSARLFTAYTTDARDDAEEFVHYDATTADGSANQVWSMIVQLFIRWDVCIHVHVHVHAPGNVHVHVFVHVCGHVYPCRVFT